MRVTNGYSPYQYQQQKMAAKQTGFADQLAKGMHPPADTASDSEQAMAQPAEPDMPSGQAMRESDERSSLALRFSMHFKYVCLANLLRSGCQMSDPDMVEALQEMMRTGKSAAANYPAALTEEQTGEESFSGLLQSRAVSSTTAASGGSQKMHHIFLPDKDTLVSLARPSGLSFNIKYAENSTEENPAVIAKGIDENGNDFEEINRRHIDLRQQLIEYIENIEKMQLKDRTE